MTTLESYLSFTFTEELQSARDTDLFAWIQTTQGVRNLFVARPPDFTPLQVTNWIEDDGLCLSQLQVADDGSALLVVRGEGKNHQGDYPNPASHVLPLKQQLLYINLQHMPSQPRELAETALACFRPGTPEVYFSRKGELFKVDTSVSEDSTEKAEKVLSIRGTISELAWSHQGDQLALTVCRNRHSFIGLFSPKNTALKWLDPSFDRDCMPVWSPNGQHLAFIRCHGGKPDFVDLWFSAVADRFELRVAPIGLLTSQPLWQCPPDHGLSIQEGGRPVTWLNNHQLIFSHETTGFDHIYQADINTETVTPLTRGEFLVHSYCTITQHKWLYFTHTENNHHGFSLARLNLNNGQQEDLQPLLPEQSISFNPALSASGEHFGFILSGPETPLTPAFFEPASGHLTHHQQAGYTSVSRQFSDVYPVSFNAPDGLPLHGQLFKPHGTGPHPALLTFHGGPFCQSLAGFSSWHGLSYAYAFCQYLADQGFVVLALNYRGSSGYGKTFRQPGPYFWKGASEYQDVLAAREWLADQQDVKEESIGLWGKSYGGYLTAQGLARNSELFRAGVDFVGCHHLPRVLRQPVWESRKFTLSDGETLDEVRHQSQMALQSSPWAYLDQWQSPVLLIHSDDDRNVDFEESQSLFDELRKRNVEVEGMAIPDEVHSFLLHQTWLSSYQRASEFLHRHLSS